MQVKCICNKGNKAFLTVGKVYDVIERCEERFKVVNDRGYAYRYFKEHFENVPAESSGKVMTCVNAAGLKGFTEGKNYNVEQSKEFDECYRVFDDEGMVSYVNKRFFIEPSQRHKHLFDVDINIPTFNFNCQSVLPQIGGTHYSDLKIQPFEFIDKNNLTFFEGNVVKYLSRYNSKDGNKDIDKAIHYVRESFERLEHFQSRTIGMTAKAYCSANNLPPVVELVLCWILEYPISIEVVLIVSLLEGLKK